MDLPGAPEARGREEVQADLVGIQRFSLALVVIANELLQASLKLAGLSLLAVLLDDGRAIAVGSGDEEDVLAPDAVAQEASEHVGEDKDAPDVSEVEVLASIGHPGRDHGPLWECRSHPARGALRGQLIRHAYSPCRSIARSVVRAGRTSLLSL